MHGSGSSYPGVSNRRSGTDPGGIDPDAGSLFRSVNSAAVRRSTVAGVQADSAADNAGSPAANDPVTGGANSATSPSMPVDGSVPASVGQGPTARASLSIVNPGITFSAKLVISINRSCIRAFIDSPATGDRSGATSPGRTTPVSIPSELGSSFTKRPNSAVRPEETRAG